MSKPLKEDLLHYRADIDGLRAIAVSAVLLFHYFPLRFKNGFLGVDVFFVISGYLVTSIIINNIEQNKFSFRQFYFKRIRRLFPSLILVLGVTTILSLIFLLSEEFVHFGKHLFSSVIFSTNIFLFNESGYFDKSSDLKPLLHLWSLCIEEQFYLIWPLLIYFLAKINKLSLFVGIFCLSLISLWLNWYLAKDYSAFNFYLLPSRLWELGVGGILAFLNLRTLKNISSHFYFQKLAVVYHVFAQYIFPVIGVYLIIKALFLLNDVESKMIYLAGLAVAGTSLLILANRHSPVNKLLSFKWLVYIGLISYPLYLWHWPLLSLSKIVLVNEVSRNLRITLLIISFLLAIGTYELIEKPIKKLNSDKVIYQILIIFFIIGLSGFAIWKFDGLPFRYNKLENLRKTKVAFMDGYKQNNGQFCSKKILDVEMCAISNITKQPTIVLIGDSHANHLYPGLNEYFSSRGENLLLLGKSGTPPMMGITKKPKANFDDIFQYIEKTHSIHTIVISAFWGSYYEQNGVYIPGASELYKNFIIDDIDPEGWKQKSIFARGLNRALDKISRQKKIIAFQDVPSLPFILESCLPRPFFERTSKCNFDIGVPLKLQENSRKEVESEFKLYPNIKIIDPMSYLCPNGICSIRKDGVILYSDEHHLSVEGAKVIMREIFSH